MLPNFQPVGGGSLGGELTRNTFLFTGACHHNVGKTFGLCVGLSTDRQIEKRLAETQLEWSNARVGLNDILDIRPNKGNRCHSRFNAKERS